MSKIDFESGLLNSVVYHVDFHDGGLAVNGRRPARFNNSHV